MAAERGHVRSPATAEPSKTSTARSFSPRLSLSSAWGSPPPFTGRRRDCCIEQDRTRKHRCNRGDGRYCALAIDDPKEGAPLRGRTGAASGVNRAKGVPRRAAPGPVGPRASPRGPARAPREARHSLPRVGGWVSPLGIPFPGGASEGGSRGETKAGEARHALCPPRWPRGGPG